MVKSAVWYGGWDIRIEEGASASLKPDEVRIEVACCGVCGTDLGTLEGKFPRLTPPRVLGHEISGTVVEIGSAVRAVRVGDRVSVDTIASVCDTCYFCRRGEFNLCLERRTIPGGFAEEVVVPERVVYRLPDRISLEVGALAEPLACALHAVDVSGLPSGGTVLIAGAGSIGLLLLQLCLRSGAARAIVSDPVAAKRELALKLGAADVIDPLREDLGERVYALTAGVGVECSFDAVGLPRAIEQAVACTRRGGTVVLVGVADPNAAITLRPRDLYERELTIRASYIRRFTFSRALEWLARLDLESLLSHRYPLERTLDAIAALRDGQSVKNLVVPGLKI